MRELQTLWFYRFLASNIAIYMNCYSFKVTDILIAVLSEPKKYFFKNAPQKGHPEEWHFKKNQIFPRATGFIHRVFMYLVI